MSPLKQLTVAVIWILVLFSGPVRSSYYCWNQQTETYNERFTPADCTDLCTVTPFFSPDTSINTYVNLIESAKKSIDIYTPSFKSWNSNCTKNTDCPSKENCTGCPLEQQKNDSFPVFPALLNAIHERGVQVRIITNNFTFSACEGFTIPLDWLVLNKIQVRFYTTTTFQHAKFIVIDKGAKTALSSVNWSYTSFMRNRESGVIVEDCTCSAISFYQSVFEYDWDHGLDYVITRTYSKSEIKYITDTAHMPYTIPNGSKPGTFVTKLIPHTNVAIKKAYASPDYARDTLLSFIGSIKESLHLAVYQVTDSGLCGKLLALHNSGINVTLLVSCHIIPNYNYYKAQECYRNLTDGGMKGRIQCACHKFDFSHEKYWIIDGNTVHLSTGNWSPSDFPMGTSWEPFSKLRHSINRDLEIVISDVGVADYFSTVYNADWLMGTEWAPKNKTTHN